MFCASRSFANACIASCDESLIGENLCLSHFGGGDAPATAAEKVAMVGRWSVSSLRQSMSLRTCVEMECVEIQLGMAI